MLNLSLGLQPRSVVRITTPVNTVAPAITGNPYLNTVLTCGTGTWSGGGSMTFAYQWKRAGVDIAGQTSSTYTMVTADTTDALPTITCSVTATNSAGNASQLSSNSVLCTPIITMSCNKIGGSMAFAGSLTRKGSPSTVIVQWGDNTNTSVTTTLSKTYSTTGVKNIRVYSEVNNIVTWTVSTASTRLVSIVATIALSSLTGMTISAQSTAGIFTTLTVKNQPALTSLSLSGSYFSTITSTQIDNLPALTTLTLSTNAGLTNLSPPALPSLATISAGSSPLLATLDVSNNPTLTTLLISRGVLTAVDISALVNLTSFTIANSGTGNISSIDVTPNNNLVTIVLNTIGMTSFTHGSLPNLSSVNLSNNSLTGTLTFNSTVLSAVTVTGNAGLTGLVVPSANILSIAAVNCELSTISVSGKPLMISLTANGNNFNTAVVDQILSDCVANNATAGTLALQGNTTPAPPSAPGLADKATLESRSWVVTVD